MQENIEYVQRGFRILLTTMSCFLWQRMRRIYKDKWWDEVMRTLGDPKDLPWSGEDAELADSLDVANCLRLIDRKCYDDLSDVLNLSCRAYARELMGVRNITAHRGQQDLDQHETERALDTMILLCDQMDKDSADEIRELYQEVRQKATPERTVIVECGLAQPQSDSVRGELTEGSLLQMEPPLVEKTAMTRKVTYGGKTVLYPVYRVRLDALYYNDQNDRIATWITQYEAECGEGTLQGLDRSIYNGVIEGFIEGSNPEAIRKTQKNIALVGQREPGVALADGRIVDGNRRFTCLRRLQRVSPEPQYFETVLMDMDIHADRKQIKLLELAIQHGEEKKVDYDQIDYAVGTWRDITETGLLTVEEYAASANEPPAEVRKRLQIAGIICEFLQSIGLPGQYHVAREYQVYSLFDEMTAPLRQLPAEEQGQLKQICFDNVLLGAVPDQRKFIRDLRTLIRSGSYPSYFKDQAELHAQTESLLSAAEIRAKEDLERFALEHSALADQYRASLERAMLRSRSVQLRSKPAEYVGKCMSLLSDIDPRLFDRLDPEERENLRASVNELSRIVEDFRKRLSV
jgi:hypothetical protein